MHPQPPARRARRTSDLEWIRPSTKLDFSWTSPTPRRTTAATARSGSTSATWRGGSGSPADVGPLEGGAQNTNLKVMREAVPALTREVVTCSASGHARVDTEGWSGAGCLPCDRGVILPVGRAIRAPSSGPTRRGTRSRAARRSALAASTATPSGWPRAPCNGEPTLRNGFTLTLTDNSRCLYAGGPAFASS